MANQLIDRNSKFYMMTVTYGTLRIDLHPNKTSGGFLTIQTIEEGEALIERLREGIETFKASKTRDISVPPSDEGQV